MWLYWLVRKWWKILFFIIIFSVVSAITCLYSTPSTLSSASHTKALQNRNIRKTAKKGNAKNQKFKQNNSDNINNLSINTDQVDENGFFNRSLNNTLPLNGKFKQIAFDYSINDIYYEGFLSLEGTENNENLYISNSCTKNQPEEDSWKIKIIINNENNKINFTNRIKAARIYSYKNKGKISEDFIEIAICCVDTDGISNYANFGLISFESTTLLPLQHHIQSNAVQQTIPRIQQTSSINLKVEEIARIKFSISNNGNTENDQVSWIYITPGDNVSNEENQDKYDFSIFCIVNTPIIASDLILSNANSIFMRYLCISKYSFAILCSTFETKPNVIVNNSPIFKNPGYFDKIVEVDCQTVLPKNVYQIKQKKQISTKPLITNNNDKIFFKSSAEDKKIIYYLTLEQINNFLNSQTHTETKTFFVFYESDKEGQENTVNYQIHHICEATISIINLKFGVQGRIFFIDKVDMQVQKSYLCMLEITNSNEKTNAAETKQIELIFDINGSDNYVISTPFVFDNYHQMLIYQRVENDKNSKPVSSIFYLDYNWTKQHYVIVMCSVDQIKSTHSSNSGFANLGNYAVIDDLSKVSNKKQMSLNIIFYNWIFNKSFNDSESTDHTYVFISTKEKSTINIRQSSTKVYVWQWISASDYRKIIQGNGDKSWWRGMYYDSFQQQIYRADELWTEKRTKTIFPDQSFNSDKSNPYVQDRFNYLNRRKPTQINGIHSASVLINTEGELAMVFDNDQKSVTLNNKKVKIGEVLLNFKHEYPSDDSLISDAYKNGYFLNFDPIGIKDRATTIQYLINSKIFLNFVRNPQFASNKKASFFSYEKNKKIITNLNQKRFNSDNQAFYGDLANFNFDMSTAGHLDLENQNFFNNHNNPIGFFYFFNARSVNLSPKNLFTLNSNYQIRFFEIIPIISYQSNSKLGNNLFSANPEQNRLFAYHSGEIYEQQNKDSLPLKSTQLSLNTIGTLADPTKPMQNFTSNLFDTDQNNEKAGLFLLNFYSTFYTSTQSILVQVGGKSVVSHISFRTKIGSNYLQHIYKRFEIILTIISLVLVSILVILWSSFFYITFRKRFFKFEANKKCNLIKWE